MKKLLTLSLALICLLTSFTFFGCNNPPRDKVSVKYYSTPADIVKLFGKEESIALIPEPAATSLTNKMQNQGKTIYRLDLQQLYDGVSKAYPQAVLMVKKSLLGSHPNLVATLESKITESVSWVKQNTATAVTAIGNHGVTTLQAAALSEGAIDGCKIYWQSASNAKTDVKNYIDGIIEIDSKKATAVSDDFFYTTSSLTTNKQSYTFIMPDGAPAIAAAKLMNDADDLSTGKTVSYGVVPANIIQAQMASGGADIILAPVNLASKLYKQGDSTDHYVMVAVVTHGNFYIMSTEKITLFDLCGKQIAVPMMGAVPDWTMQMVLKKHGLSHAVVE